MGVNVTGQRVLIFGDSLSHVGPDAGPEAATITATGTYSAPGALLAQNLLRAGASAARVDARVGRSAYNFFAREASGPLLQADLTWKPTLVIVLLGTNDLGLSMAKDGDKMAQIRAAFVPTAEVWGIGPPSFADAALQGQTEAVVAMMRQVFGARFIDARPMTADLTDASVRTRDLVHFQRPGAVTWADRLTRAVLAVPDRAGATPGPIATIGSRPLQLGLGLSFLGLLVAAVMLGRQRRYAPAT